MYVFICLLIQGASLSRRAVVVFEAGLVRLWMCHFKCWSSSIQIQGCLQIMVHQHSNPYDVHVSPKM